MPCIAALIPRKAYTQRLVGSRVPVTAARGGGTDLQRDGTHSSDVPYGHVVTADGETADLALRERAAETVDVIGIDNGRLDTHGIEFRGADAARGDTVCRKCSRLDTAGIDRHGVDLRRGKGARVNPCRADIGQRVRRKRAVRALRQSNEPMAADLLLDGSREGARRGGIGLCGTALEDKVVAVSDLRSCRNRRRTITAALYRLVGVEVLHGTRIAAATQEDGEHAVVAAQLRPGEHPAVGLGKVIDIP